MARNTKLYGMEAVDDYMERGNFWNCCETIEGVLLDNIIIWHADGTVEVFEERYLNCWSSAYVRHIYRKGLPKMWEQALDDERARLEAEDNDTAYFEALQNGTFDIMNEMI